MLKYLKQNKIKAGAVVTAIGAATIAGANALGVEVPGWVHALVYVFGAQ